MKAPRQVYRYSLAILIIAMMLFPILGISVHGFGFQERVQPVAQPTQFLDGVIKRQWQAFLEQRFLERIGNVRSFLVLLYNETRHRLFRSRPNAFYVWTPEMGYYPVDTIRRLNDEVLHRDEIRRHYERAARRLRILQRGLGNYGVALVVVIPPPKVRLYPEFAGAYLLAPPEAIMSRAISYGDVLESSGVNVVNVERIFRDRKASSPWPFFTTTSFHWSFWAGCVATDELLRKAETVTGHRYFSVDCSDTETGKSQYADADIAAILNIFSTSDVIGEAPFPKIVPKPAKDDERRRLVIIGDSFSDQIVYALGKSVPDANWSPEWLVRYDNFRSKQSIGIDGRMGAHASLQRQSILPEILTRDLLVIEESDGAVYRYPENLGGMEFGATELLLRQMLSRGAGMGMAPGAVLTDGWHSANGYWATTGPVAGFGIGNPGTSKAAHLVLDVENLVPDGAAPRRLDVLMDGRQIGVATMPSGRGSIDVLVPTINRWQDMLVAEVSIRDPGGKMLDMHLHGLRLAGDGVRIDVPTTISSPRDPERPEAAAPAANLISQQDYPELFVDGLGGFETNGKEKWRWGTGPATRIRFYVDPTLPEQARQLLLEFSFRNGVPIPNQALQVRLNGAAIKSFSAAEIPVHLQVDVDLTFRAKAGLNVLELAYGDWNHGKKDYTGDPRPLALAMMRLSLKSATNAR